MRRLEEFRIYYNQTIHPELMRLERKRLRLLLYMFITAVVVSIWIVLLFYWDIMAITLISFIPIIFVIFYQFYLVRKFKQQFKPQIMNLITDFIDDGLNYGTLHYDAKRSIPKDVFLKSGLFSTKAPYYEGEDYIEGKVGEMNFEMCELNVKDLSRVQNSLNDVFKGVFLHAKFPERVKGKVVVWPRKYRQYMTKAIKNFTWDKAKNVDKEILNKEFKNIFMTYATQDTHVVGILPITMQKAIVDYVNQTGKDIYIAFIQHNHRVSEMDIYAAVTEEKDILEPNIFLSNVSFELVREFFEDISLVLQIVEDFDKTH